MEMAARLAAGVAHEIRNPLAAMMNAASLLQESERLGAGDMELAEILLEEARRINRIVGEVLVFARPPVLARRPVALAPLVESTMALARRDPRFCAGVVLRSDLPADLPPVLADPDRIRELLWNLLLNAAQAVGPGGRVELHGETRLNGVSPVVALRVEDSGRGIPEELRQRVFEPFETTKVSGTGLGLSLVRSIVLAHGGSIEITDSELGGACLSFWLPQAGTRDIGPDPKA